RVRRSVCAERWWNTNFYSSTTLWSYRLDGLRGEGMDLNTTGAQTPPAHMNLITAHQERTGRQVAEQNVLALNVAMFSYYDRALFQYQQNLLAQHPVILALFSGAGGDFTLYRPGMPPLRAPSVPIVYQLLKSVGHATMAVFQIVAPHIGKPTDESWRALMEVDRTQHRL